MVEPAIPRVCAFLLFSAWSNRRRCRRATVSVAQQPAARSLERTRLVGSGPKIKLDNVWSDFPCDVAAWEAPGRFCSSVLTPARPRCFALKSSRRSPSRRMLCGCSFRPRQKLQTPVSNSPRFAEHWARRRTRLPVSSPNQRSMRLEPTGTGRDENQVTRDVPESARCDVMGLLP